MEENANMEPATFAEITKSVQLLENSRTLRDALEPVKVIFDGSSADAFKK